MSAGPSFVAAVREELWVRGRLVERRLSCGEAIEQDDVITARDCRDSALIERCDEALRAMQPLVDARFDVRLFAEATRDDVIARMVLSDGACAIVSTPEHVAADTLLLASAAAPAERRPLGEAARLPFLWRNGSAAVLLHEAVGHPLEQETATTLPAWLHVDAPMQSRRASFRDVPLRRMTSLSVRQENAPFELPAERVEIALVDGGSWDPLTDLVRVRVSRAERISRSARFPLEPFTITASRTKVVESLRGAEGEPERYPGVICSREGQEMFVASNAPLVVTELG